MLWYEPGTNQVRTRYEPWQVREQLWASIKTPTEQRTDTRTANIYLQ